MPTPIYQHRNEQPAGSASRQVRSTTHPKNDWRCTRCDKLLGVCWDGQLHLRFARGHEYLVSFPAVATCRGCGTLNRASSPAH